MYWDAHIHTSFSGDCNIEPMDMINRGRELGLLGMTITDHMDLDYPLEPSLFHLDLSAYNSKISDLKGKISDDSFKLNYGIELGLSKDYIKENSDIAKSYNFDYIIGSIHVVDGKDPYYSEFYENKKMNDVLREYFLCTLENITKCDFYDSLGHLDYIIRYAKRFAEEKGLNEAVIECDDIIEQILLTLIKKEKALEVNTGAFRAGMDRPNPSFEVLRKYYDMGGRLITLGSDAHKCEHVAICFEKVAEALKCIGFDSFYVYNQHIPIELGL